MSHITKNDERDSMDNIEQDLRGYAVFFSGDLGKVDKEGLRKAYRAGRPALIVSSTGSSGIEEKKNKLRMILQEATGCTPERILSISDVAGKNSIYSPIAHFPYVKVIKGSFVAVENDELLNDEPTARGLTYLFLEKSAEYFRLVENDCWSVLIDETGPFNELSKTSKGGNSTMIAVIKPPGVVLPPAPIGFHSCEENSKKNTSRLLEMLHNTKSLVFVFLKFKSASKTPDLKHGVTGDDLHSRMWRTMIIACLEIISDASHSHDSSIRDVRMYMEEASSLKPSNKYFDNLMAQVKSAVGSRKGWEYMRLSNPRIIPKNSHPWLAYPDALGSVLHSTVRDTRFLPPHNEKSIMLHYTEESSVAMESMVLTSWAAPEQSIMAAASLNEEHFKALEPVFDIVARDRFTRLEGAGAHTLVVTLLENLVKRPSVYYATGFLCSRIPSKLLEEGKNPEMAFLLNLNGLYSANHRGEEEAAEQSLAALEGLIGKTKNAELHYKYHLGKADHRLNCLCLKEALDEIREFVPEARNNLGILNGSAWLMSQYAQFLAFNKQPKAALGIFDEISPHIMNPSDMERLNVYRAHALYDQGDFNEAVKSVERAITDGHDRSLVDSCALSQYLRAVVLKINATRPFLSKNDLSRIIDLPLPEGFPWVNIAYWAFRSGKIADIDTSAIQARLRDKLKGDRGERSDVLALVNAVFTDALVKEGVLPGGPDYRGSTEVRRERTRVNEWLVRQEAAPSKERDALRGLIFYLK